MPFSFFAGYGGDAPVSHVVEDWSDGGVTGTPIAARTLTVDGIACERLAYADWSSLGGGSYGVSNEAWVGGDGSSDPAWTSPAMLSHQITAHHDTVAFGITLFPGNYHYSPTLPTQIDVEIATVESGFGGTDVARFRAEMNQSTMGSVANVKWGALQADSSSVDAGDAGDIYYTLGFDIFGNWEVLTLGPDTGSFQAGGSGTALIKSPSNTYLVRTMLQNSGWLFNTNVNQIRAWTWSPPITEPPVCRLYPRDDGLGSTSGPRLYPPPKASRLIGGLT